jgi:thiamine-phosphate pyrophosphorylase
MTLTTTSPMTNTDTLANTLVDLHSRMVAGQPLSTDEARRPEDAAHSPEQAAVLQACRRLGFVEHDARCVAQAWAAQTRRQGHFSAQDWPQEAADFGMSPWPRENAFPPCPKELGLYAVLPDAEWVKRMANAGVPTVQLRFKSSDPRAVRQEIEAAVRAVEGTSSLLFINDHWEAAIDAGAYGLHLGQEDLAQAPLERIRASGIRLGVSTHGYAEMLLADQVSPSYLALGAVFPTTLKRMATAPQGTGRLQAYARLMQAYPLVAIGGIDQDKLPDVMRSGVGSVAVVRAIIGSPDPEAAAKSLMQMMRR